MTISQTIPARPEESSGPGSRAGAPVVRLVSPGGDRGFIMLTPGANGLGAMEMARRFPHSDWAPPMRLTVSAIKAAFRNTLRLGSGAFALAIPTLPVGHGQRVFTVGHSFHVWVAPILEEIAQSAGLPDHSVVGVSSLGGSRVMQHWKIPDEHNAAKQALRAGKVDVLTLSNSWLPDPGIEDFARFGLEFNPRFRVTLQEIWLPNDTYLPVYPLEARVKVDHNAATLAQLRRDNARYRNDMETYVRDLNRRLGAPIVLIVPVGQAVIALRGKVIAGEAPGIRTQAELFADNWGHPNPPIKALAAYCHFAVIYRRSPVGLPVPSILAKSKNRRWADPQLNELLQQLAWTAVVTNPLSGVPNPDWSVAVRDSNSGLDPAIGAEGGAIQAGICDIVEAANHQTAPRQQNLSFADDLALSPDDPFLVFDLDRESFLGVFRGGVPFEIAPGASRRLLIRPATGAPQVIAATGDATGADSIEDVGWNAAEGDLWGISDAEPGKPYSLWIYLPDGKPPTGVNAKAEDEFKSHTPFATQQHVSGNVLRLDFPGQPGSVRWRIDFRPPAGPPPFSTAP